MSTQNFYALLGDDENEDPTAVIDRATTPAAAADKQQPAAAVAKKQQQQPPPSAPAKLPVKFLTPTDAVKEGPRAVPYEGGSRGRGGRLLRGGGRGAFADRGDVGNGRSTRNGETDGGRGYLSDRPIRGDDGDLRSSDAGGRGRGRGRGRDHRERVFGADGEDRSRRREFDRHSGSGRGHEMKRDGAGRGNWGTDGDQVNIPTEAPDVSKEDEKASGDQDEKKGELDVQPDPAGEEPEEKKEEDNEMTLDEYEKILEEKKKALPSHKAEERKVKADKAFESMHLVDRKNDNDVFIKLGSDKDKGKKKESIEKEEKTRKVVNINEFLKPADGEKYYGLGGRGRGRGRDRGDRGGFRGGFAGAFGSARRVSAPRIEDPGQFPTLSGGK